jgi:hypothetical protein
MGSVPMKKFLVAIMIVLTICGTAFAGGDKNHADKAEGPAGESNPGIGDNAQNSR